MSDTITRTDCPHGEQTWRGIICPACETADTHHHVSRQPRHHTDDRNPFVNDDTAHRTRTVARYNADCAHCTRGITRGADIAYDANVNRWVHEMCVTRLTRHGKLVP